MKQKNNPETELIFQNLGRKAMGMLIERELSREDKSQYEKCSDRAASIENIENTGGIADDSQIQLG